jgi:hypothetical protein
LYSCSHLFLCCILLFVQLPNPLSYAVHATYPFLQHKETDIVCLLSVRTAFPSTKLSAPSCLSKHYLALLLIKYMI